MESYLVPNRMGVNQSNTKYATQNKWCRVISHNPIIPVMMHHFLIGDTKELFGATPFEVLHQ